MFGLVKSLAEKDSLTLLYNHGAFHEKLAIELERANRYVRRWRSSCWTWTASRDQRPVRHTTGDRVLALVAGVLGAHLRKTDIAARTAGRVRGDPSGDRSVLRGGDRGADRHGDLERPAGHRGGSVISFTRASGTPPAATTPPAWRDPGHADRLMFESKRGARRRARDTDLECWRPNGPESRRAYRLTLFGRM